MSGLMRKFDFEAYNQQLKTMSDPVMASQLPKVKLNLHGIRDYARKKGVAVASLSEAEKKMFMQI